MNAGTAVFDHLIHWVDDLDAAMTAYDEVGLQTHQAITMPGFRNAAWGIDDERYVELATVEDWDAVTASPYAGSLELLRPAVDALGGPGLLTFAVDVPDARVTAARLREAGHDVEEIEIRLEDRDAGFVEVFVRDVPAYFPFFITYDPPRAEIGRMRAEHRAAQGIVWAADRPDLAALLIRSPDPAGEAGRLAELVGCRVDGTTVQLPGAQVRFEEGATPGLFGISVRHLEPVLVGEPVGELAGVTIRAER